MFRLRALALIAADAAVLAGLRPDFAATGRHLRHPAGWLHGGLDRACIEACETALWALAGWVAVGLLITLAGAGSGPVAAGARAAGKRLLPATTRRLLAAAVGAGVALTPVAAAAAGPPPPQPGATVSAAPTPAWPVDPSPAIAPGPAWPHDKPAAAHPAAPVPPAQPAPARVTVRAGDSLWLIARRRLGPQPSDEQVAAAWPRWYAANRTTVGADPSLIRPGQILHTPTD